MCGCICTMCWQEHAVQLLYAPPGSDLVIAGTSKRQLLTWQYNPHAAHRRVRLCVYRTQLVADPFEARTVKQQPHCLRLSRHTVTHVNTPCKCYCHVLYMLPLEGCFVVTRTGLRVCWWSGLRKTTRTTSPSSPTLPTGVCAAGSWTRSRTATCSGLWCVNLRLIRECAR